MKKTMGLLIGVVALLVVAVPARACVDWWCQPDEPEAPVVENYNTVKVTQVVTSDANTGGNKLSVTGTKTGWGCWTQYSPAVGTIKTGDARATSLGQVGINVQESCATCGVAGDVTNKNFVMATNMVFSDANTGLNRLRVTGGTGSIGTGNATSLSDALTVVNIQVSPELSN